MINSNYFTILVENIILSDDSMNIADDFMINSIMKSSII